jgi:hypothetical protein
MSTPTLFRFGFTPLASGTNNVDRVNGVIKGVSLITSGVQARGHDLEVDETTLTQMLACAVEKGQVPVKLNHQSGVENVCGYINTFRIDGNKLLGDWHLLKSHKETDAMLEKAERMPSCFGLSGAFMGNPEKVKATTKGGKVRNLARCTELLAVDCVTQPAANPDGLFSAILPEAGVRVDTSDQGNMPAEPTKPLTLEDVMAAITQQNETIAAFGERFDSIEAQMAEAGAAEEGLTQADIEQLSGMTDAELLGLNLTRAEVDAAVAEANAGAGEGAEGGAGDGGGGEGAGAAAGVSGALASLQRQISGVVNHLEAGVRQQEESQVENAFAVIETKVGELTTLLAAKDAEIGALRHAFETGEKRPLGSGVEAVNLFSAGEGAGAFAQLVTAKTTELMAGGALSAVRAKSQAVQFCIKHHSTAYQEFRANPKGVTRL